MVHGSIYNDYATTQHATAFLAAYLSGGMKTSKKIISSEGYTPTEDLTTHMQYKTNHFMDIQYI